MKSLVRSDFANSHDIMRNITYLKYIGESMNIKDELNFKLIPKEWHDIIQQSEFTSLSGGKSGMLVYRMDLKAGNKSYLLKYSTNMRSIEELKYESNILEILMDEDFSPIVYFTIFDGNFGMSLREYVKGVPIIQSDLDAKKIVEICSNILRKIHSLEIDCNRIKVHSDQLKEAEENVLNHRVDESDFEDEYAGMSAEELFEIFSRVNCNLNISTFTHGDFNYPNIIYSDESVKVIDWGRAGLSDKYRDLSLLIRELYDYEDKIDIEELYSIIISNYGLESIDMRKTKYFIMMDEFF